MARNRPSSLSNLDFAAVAAAPAEPGPSPPAGSDRRARQEAIGRTLASMEARNSARDALVEAVREKFGSQAPADASEPSGTRPADEPELPTPAELVVEPELMCRLNVARARIVEECRYRRADGVECRLRPGEPIPEEVPAAQVDRWIIEGAAVRQETRTVRFLMLNSYHAEDGSLYDRPYGKLAVVSKAQADLLCSKTGSYGPSAELIQSTYYYNNHTEAWRGDPRTLHPCPPVRRGPHEVGVMGPPGDARPPQTYVRLRWSWDRAPSGSLPGSVSWVEADRAAALAIDGRGKLVDAAELPDRVLERLAKTEPARPGGFFLVSRTAS